MHRNNRIARLLLKKYLQGKCTPEEIELLHRWYDKLPPYLPSGVTDRVLLEEQLRQAVWNKINQGQAPVRRLRYRLPAAAVFIGILVLSVIFWFSRTSSHFNEIANTTTGVRRIVLPDSTVVRLNANSRLRWNDDFAAGNRYVELDGEGYFDVAKDAAHPFRVLSKGVETRVLGTSFNVEGYRNEPDVRIALVKGSVEVVRLNSHDAAVRLQPGDIAQVDTDGHRAVAIERGDAGSYGAWTGGGFILQNVPLEDALQRLCHKYGYRLKENFPAGRRKPITVSYYQNSFEEILDGLLYINHLNYSIRDSVITIY